MLILLDSLLQERPHLVSRCPRKPTFSSPSPSLPSSSSRRPLALWILTRMVFCLPQIFRQLLLLMARTLVEVKLRLCLTKLMGQSTSPRWSPSLLVKWLVVLMTMMLFLHLLKLLRWMAKSMLKADNLTLKAEVELWKSKLSKAEQNNGKMVLGATKPANPKTDCILMKGEAPAAEQKKKEDAPKKE